MQRAYSLLNIKSIDDAEGTITGIATTPTADRYGDIVEPKGAQFKLPLPLLWQHDAGAPIGHVLAAKVTDAGIEITAKIARGVLPKIDDAWTLIKSGLVRGLSIGFRSIGDPEQIKGTWSFHFKDWEWLELSAVTIPANAEASIQTVKSYDEQQRRAASGAPASVPVVRLDSAPGATGPQPTKGSKTMKTIAEQIAAFEQKRAASAARREEIQTKAIEAGRSKDEAEKQEFDNLTAEIETIDSELKDLRTMEAQAAKSATPVTKAAGADPKAAAAARGVPLPEVIQVPNTEKGIAFTRYVKALIAGRGNAQLALMHAEAQKSWRDQTPQVIEVLKTAVAGGTTTSSGWASELVYNQNLVGEFIELLRPQTVIGKIPGLTRVPFNVRMSGQDSGSTAYWVGQGKPVPVSKLNTTEVTLGIAKAAGLVVLTKELVRSSEPSAELIVRNDLIKTISQFMDVQFLDPSVAAVTNVSPASITNAVTATTPTGTALANLRTDVQTLFRAFIAQNDDPLSAVWIMDPSMALTISLMQNALGQPEFPQISMSGGTFFGLPVVVSNSANITGSPDSGHMIILAKASDILYADEGGTEIDASDQASIQMLDNPTNDASDGTPTTMVSMFQTNSVAIKAVRFVNWKKRRSTAVSYIKEAQYVA